MIWRVRTFAVATKMRPDEANGKCFAVANNKYDMLRKLVEGVAKVYGGKDIEYKVTDKGNMLSSLVGISQALKSERLRKLTGWRPDHMGS